MAYHNIRMTDLAKKTGLSVQSIKTLKDGEEISAKTLNKICLALNLEIKDVMRFEQRARGWKE